MPFRDRLSKACSILLSYQNSDGGIAATKSGDPSGCWTTADALEAFINSSAFTKYGAGRVRKMVEFLLNSQICEDPTKTKNDPTCPVNPDVGGWPLIQGTKASTMATGHAVGSLQLVRNLFIDEISLVERMDRAIQIGFEWLTKFQNGDGGWGSEPSAGGDGKNSRIVATYHALIGFWYRGGTFQTSTVVRRATINFFLESRNRDGSWGFTKGLEGDISNTARAITALLRSGYCDKNSPIVQKGIKFIIANQEQDTELWDLGHEGFLYQNASGEVIYNNNCIFDALVCLLTAGYSNRETQKALKWFLDSQEENGLWYLSSPKRRIKDIYTWSTAEWITAVDLAEKEYVGRIAEIYEAPPKWKRHLLLTGLTIIVVGETVYIFLGNLIGNIWQNLSEGLKDLILVGILLAIVVNIISGFAQDFLEREFNRTKQRIYRFVMRRGSKNQTNV